jgi:hypothetical protein
MSYARTERVVGLSAVGHASAERVVDGLRSICHTRTDKVGDGLCIRVLSRENIRSLTMAPICRRNPPCVLRWWLCDSGQP